MEHIIYTYVHNFYATYKVEKARPIYFYNIEDIFDLWLY